MAIIKYREFTIRTEEHCDAKNTKRHPVQLLDRKGYHYRYYHALDAAERAVNNWWVWQERLAKA